EPPLRPFRPEEAGHRLTSDITPPSSPDPPDQVAPRLSKTRSSPGGTKHTCVSISPVSSSAARSWRPKRACNHWQSCLGGVATTSLLPSKSSCHVLAKRPV